MGITDFCKMERFCELRAPSRARIDGLTGYFERRGLIMEKDKRWGVAIGIAMETSREMKHWLFQRSKHVDTTIMWGPKKNLNGGEKDMN